MWIPQKPPYARFKKKKYADVLQTFSFVYQLGDSPILRQSSQEVGDITSEEFKEKLAYLKRCLSRYRRLTGMGVGIAAVQVGIPERFAIIHMPTFDQHTFIIINPRIVKTSEKQLLYPEMCMSAHPCIALVKRSAWIEFTYYDIKGEEQYWNRKSDDEVGKRLNRVFQHEIDHMDGIINIDRVESKDIIFESDPHFYKNAKFVEDTVV